MNCLPPSDCCPRRALGRRLQRARSGWLPILLLVACAAIKPALAQGDSQRVGLSLQHATGPGLERSGFLFYRAPGPGSLTALQSSIRIMDVALGQAHDKRFLEAFSARITGEGKKASIHLQVERNRISRAGSYFVMAEIRADQHYRIPIEIVIPTALLLAQSGARVGPSAEPSRSQRAVVFFQWLVGTSVLLLAASTLQHRRARNRWDRLASATPLVSRAAARRLAALAREATWPALMKQVTPMWRRWLTGAFDSSPLVIVGLGSLALLWLLNLLPSSISIPAIWLRRALISMFGLGGGLCLVWLQDEVRLSLRIRRLRAIAARAGSADLIALTAFPELGERSLQILGRHVHLRWHEVEGNSHRLRECTSDFLRGGGLYRLSLWLSRELRSSESVAQFPSEHEQPEYAEELPIPVLTPEDQQRLDVVLFALDFELTTESVCTLALPLLGATRKVDFYVRAPSLQTETKARMRLGIFRDNRLIQSFIFECPLAAIPAPTSHGALIPEPEFAQTAHFLDVQRLAGRALSIGINDDRAGAHTLTLKAKSGARSINLSEAAVDAAIRKVRAALLKATLDANGGPRFPAYPAGPGRSEQFDACIRELARVGSELYQMLFISTDLTDEEILAVADSSDEIIQVVRLVAQHAFPWGAIYDFDLPEKVAGEKEPPVCNGTLDGNPCGHRATDAVFCVRGFWGIRHQVEQLISGVGADCPSRLEGNTVRVAVGAFKGSAASEQRLRTSFAETLKTQQVKGLDDGVDLLDLLWNQATRPATLVLLGHFETERITGEPEGPRIAMAPPRKPLTLNAVFQRVKRETWKKPPRPLLLLMTCGSAAIEVDTMQNFALTLYKAGASAIVGTECLIFPSLGERCAQEVVRDVYSGAYTLGQAITKFRRQLAQQGNPLGLVFTFLGAADLAVQTGKSE